MRAVRIFMTHGADAMQLILPLTCLAPDIVEAILDGRQPKGLRLAEMLGSNASRWDEQRARWCRSPAD